MAESQHMRLWAFFTAELYAGACVVLTMPVLSAAQVSHWVESWYMNLHLTDTFLFAQWQYWAIIGALAFLQYIFLLLPANRSKDPFNPLVRFLLIVSLTALGVMLPLDLCACCISDADVGWNWSLPWVFQDLRCACTLIGVMPSLALLLFAFGPLTLRFLTEAEGRRLAHAKQRPGALSPKTRDAAVWLAVAFGYLLAGLGGWLLMDYRDALMLWFVCRVAFLVLSGMAAWNTLQATVQNEPRWPGMAVVILIILPVFVLVLVLDWV